MKFRNYLRNNFHNFRLFLMLLKSNSLLDLSSFVFLSIFNISKVMKLNIGGISLSLRTSSTDLTVAASCLIEDEFSVAREFSQKSTDQFILDAGGYIGTASIALAKMFPESTIIVLEPSKDNFNILKQNVSQFKQIVPLNMALTGKDSQIKLYDQGTGNWGFSTVSNSTQNVTCLQEIQGISVESLLEKFQKNGVDLIKLDIEGGEKDVLDASSSWIHKVGILIAELHERKLAGCEASFEKATAFMKKVKIEGEKVVAINESHFVQK